MVNAREEEFKTIMMDDVVALFTNARVDRASVPENLFCYDVRHDDCCQGEACEIKSYVAVNHWGTIIKKEALPLEEGSYYPKDDFNYLGDTMSLEEFERATFNELGEPMDVAPPQIEM